MPTQFMTKDLRDKFDLRQGDFEFNFRMYNSHSDTFGEAYMDTKKVWINLVKHESINAIIDTIIHESLHCALIREDMVDDIEHEIVRRMMQVESGMFY